MTIALTDGRWVAHGGVLIWDTTPTVAEVRSLRRKPTETPFNPKLVACPTCRATVTQCCRTVGGNPTTPHNARLVSRRCPCGSLLEPRKTYCETCRERARKETYRLREINQPTARRRAA